MPKSNKVDESIELIKLRLRRIKALLHEHDGDLTKLQKTINAEKVQASLFDGKEDT